MKLRTPNILSRGFVAFRPRTSSTMNCILHIFDPFLQYGGGDFSIYYHSSFSVMRLHRGRKTIAGTRDWFPQLVKRRR
jgi:hypothetical protein